MKEIEETYIFHSAFLLRSHFRTKATFGRRCQSEQFQPPFASGARAWKKKTLEAERKKKLKIKCRKGLMVRKVCSLKD